MRQRFHPSNALILATLNGTAPIGEARKVREHLPECGRCRRLSQEYESLLGAIHEVSREQSESQADTVGLHFAALDHSGLHSSALRITGGLLAAVVLAAVFLWFGEVHRVSAGEVLSLAERAETRARPVPASYRLQTGNVICRTAGRQWSQRSSEVADTCASIHDALVEARWDAEAPLSIRAYKSWHDSLRQRHDSVLRNDPYWTIQTETNEGLLRAASLRLQRDYRPVELKLDFVNLSPISVVRDAFNARRETLTASSAVPRELPEARDAVADIEARAWLALHGLGIDSGWEATVVRESDHVTVIAINSDAAHQRQIRNAIAEIGKVAFEPESVSDSGSAPGRLFPSRLPTGTSRPLGEDMLERSFPDPLERGSFVTKLSNVSRAIVGDAFVYEHVARCRAAVSPGPTATALDSLLQQDRSRLMGASLQLMQLLARVIDLPARTPRRRPFSYKEAQQLDAAVQRLFTASEFSPDVTLAQTLARVNQLF